MKYFLTIAIAVLTVFANGDLTAQVSSTPPCRAGTLDLRASDCQDWVTILANKVDRKGSKPQALDSIDYCSQLYNEGYSANTNQLFQICYDTLMIFIDSCPNHYESWRAFDMMGGAVGNFLIPNDRSYDSTLWTNYRTWLESVLYLNNTDPEYFCQDVEQIAGSYAYSVPDSTPAQLSKASNIGFAIYRWLILNTNCDDNLTDLYKEGRQGQYKQWYNDSVAGVYYPLDTTLPTMADLGLDTLLARHQLTVVPDQPISIITNATASPNPVSTGTVITFGISQEAYVKINLFDLLGAPVSGEGFEGLFAPGNHEVPLSLQGLPSGTYFARILTAYGNVATVKLVKE